jgi:hypothetical protein
LQLGYKRCRDAPAPPTAQRQVTEDWVLAPLRNRQFFSLAEANAAIAEQLAMVNDRPFRGQPTSRRALFDELERAALQPLPSAPFELAEWKPGKVNIKWGVPSYGELVTTRRCELPSCST